MGTPVYPQDTASVINRLQNRTKEAANRNVVVAAGVTIDGVQDIIGRKTFKDLLTIELKDLLSPGLIIVQPNEVSSTSDTEMFQVYYQNQKGIWGNEKANLRIRRVDREVPLKIFGKSLTNPTNGDTQVDLMQWYKRVEGDDVLCARIGSSGGWFGRRIETDTGPNEFAGDTTFLGDIIANDDIDAAGDITATGDVAGNNLAADLTIGARTAITIDSPTVGGRYSANAGTTQYAPTVRLMHGDEVQLSGRIEHGGAVTTANDVMASDVGTGFHPAKEVNLSAAQQGGAAAAVRINTSGQLIMLRTTTTTWTSLDGLSYRKT